MLEHLFFTQCFVIYAILEYAVAHYLRRQEDRANAAREQVERTHRAFQAALALSRASRKLQRANSQTPFVRPPSRMPSTSQVRLGAAGMPSIKKLSTVSPRRKIKTGFETHDASTSAHTDTDMGRDVASTSSGDRGGGSSGERSGDRGGGSSSDRRGGPVDGTMRGGASIDHASRHAMDGAMDGTMRASRSSSSSAGSAAVDMIRASRSSSSAPVGSMRCSRTSGSSVAVGGAEAEAPISRGSRTSGSVAEGNAEAPDLVASHREVREARRQAGRVDRWLMDSHGDLLLRDEQLDIFSRYAFPLAYVCVCLAHYASVPSPPGSALHACPANLTGTTFV